MIYLVIGINHEGKIIPLYSSTNEEQSRKAKYIMEIEREWRELDKIKLLIEIE